MSESDAPQTNTPNPQRSFGLRVNEQDMQTHYANAFRVHTTTDEVMLDLGFNMVTVNRQPNADPKAQAGTVQIDWNQRAVVNYRTAKGVAIELGRIIRAYEERFGEIQMPQNQGQAPNAANNAGDAASSDQGGEG